MKCQGKGHWNFCRVGTAEGEGGEKGSISPGGTGNVPWYEGAVY